MNREFHSREMVIIEIGGYFFYFSYLQCSRSGLEGEEFFGFALELRDADRTRRTMSSRIERETGGWSGDGNVRNTSENRDEISSYLSSG